MISKLMFNYIARSFSGLCLATTSKRLVSACLLVTAVLTSPVSVAGPNSDIGAQAETVKVLVLGTRHARVNKLELLSQLGKLDGRFEIDYQMMPAISADTDLNQLIAPFDSVWFDSVGGRDAKTGFARMQPLVNNAKVFIPLKLPQGSPLQAGVTSAQQQAIFTYYDSGGEENLRRMLTYMTGIFDKVDLLPGETIQPASVLPASGIYHPEAKQVFASLDAYLLWRQPQTSAPVIGIQISRDGLAAADTGFTDHMVRSVEAKGGVAVAFYTPSTAVGHIAKLLTNEHGPRIDSLINTRSIHRSGMRRQDFEQLGITVLQSLPYRDGNAEKWQASSQGISAMATPFYLTMPEIAGVADPVVTGAYENDQLVAIDYQVDMLVDKALRNAQLHRADNADKKVAIMFYNHPPGERSAGASFLNIPRSLEQITTRLSAEGYQVDTLPEARFIAAVEQMLKPYYRDLPLDTIKGLGQTQTDSFADLLPLSTYHNWYDALPESIRSDIEAYWGQPETTFSVTERDGQKYFVIPRFAVGNVIILPQPPRGSRAEDESKLFHDLAVPVSHHYLAAYLYTREHFGANAVVHLGTHGSQEWLPGKERGLSAFDAGNLALGDMPVLYPYIMDDVGEAMQAKRRGRAITISHLPPPMSKSGLYAELNELHDLMHEYGELTEGAVKEQTQLALIEAAEAQSLTEDIGLSRAEIDADFTQFLTQLHELLAELGGEVQPLGLHTFGTVPEDKLLASTIEQMLGDEYSEYASIHGREFATDLHQHSHDNHAADEGDLATAKYQHPLASDSALADFEQLQKTPAYRLIKHYVFDGDDLNDIKNDTLRDYLIQGREYLNGFRQSEELDSLINGLSGGYIKPSNGGDPIRDPSVLPSGRNLYGMNPAKMPTKSAWEAGRKLTEQMIADYHNQHGVFPDKVTYSLWSIEAMRHNGVVESQALAAMGVRPVWNDRGNVTGVEVIPYAELNRPRVDVVLSATGLYRDALPNLAQMLAKAAETVAKLDEDNNFVRANSLKLRDELHAEGLSLEESTKISMLRVFSSQSGSYGTGLADATLASDQWEDDAPLAQMYLSRMGIAFGSDDDSWGLDLRHLNLYARALSGTDAAVLSRTSNVYGLLTSDDPFQYLGGLSMAIEQIDGKRPEMFISNLRNASDMKMEAADAFISRELRTRQFHPQWIEALKDEGYAGSLEMTDSMNNFWGWQVMDPNAVRADQWQEFFEVYVQDKHDLKMKEYFEDVNPEAMSQMMERMLEAVRKDYWDADEATLTELVETYTEIVDKHDLAVTNKALEEFVTGLATGFGMEAPLDGATPSALPQVQGQLLRKVEQQSQEPEPDFTFWLLWLSLFVPVAFGAIAQLTGFASRLTRFQPWKKMA
ncbi:cobaltochelatase subunit CobN [Shewanella youngdeokensis]|uniref:Cobaltochelatase subunit CobN n=1 Tax=Shewanella youngdeokensis TaxID=2999068 RepID=A0ABZ0JX97_9GAMM|nr:cobaltochelatase subunit CobN [Shewanella sp. DAU334]